MMLEKIALAAGVLMLAACVQTKKAPTPGDVAEGAGIAVEDTRRGFGDAVLAPAEDLNLKRDKIPQVLKDIDLAYKLNGTPSCQALADEISILTATLGLDEDQLAGKSGKTKAEEIGEDASNAALDAVSGLTTDFIPFRSIVRRVSGASAYQKRAQAAVLTGLKRRAFLKGVGLNMNCPPPAAPEPFKPEDATE